MPHRDFYPRRVRESAGLLNSLASSYRMLVDAAREFNCISLAHRHDVEEAIERADKLGEIIDEVLKELKKQVRELFRCWADDPCGQIAVAGAAETGDIEEGESESEN